MRRALYLWSLPCGLVGLAAAALLGATGRITRQPWWHGGGLHVLVDPRLTGPLRRRGWLAFTLGWTVFYWGGINPTIQRHELEHVRQGLRWGIAFWPAYLLCLWFCGYRENPFEVAARRAAGEP